MAVLLENPVRSYAWGSPTVIPELLGLQPTGEPQAELWVGAHPGSPSVVAGDGRTLGEYVASDPVGALGAAVVDRFGTTLPYLLKILAVQRPLSIQAHPTIEQAVAGFAAEDAAGVPLDSPKRSYRDRNHKPEMVVALTDFQALLGFREPAEIAAALEATGRNEFDEAVSLLHGDDGLRSLTGHWLTLSDADAGRLVGVLVREALLRRPDEQWDVVARLAEEHPGDRGVLLALLMRLVRLRPGEAAFVAAGVPHAYLSGVAVEPQASSDNTLRAGLTPKHVDTAEVQRILRYEPDGGLLIRPEAVGAGEHMYPVHGLDEFRLSRLDPAGSEIMLAAGLPRLVLVVDGAMELTADGFALPLRRGRAAFVTASERDVAVSGSGVAFTVVPGL